MKTILTLLLLTCTILKTNAQAQIQWQRCYGGAAAEQCNAIRTIYDGGYIIAGYTNSIDGDVSGGHGGTDGWILKTTATGAIEWQKCYGGSGSDFLVDIRQTPDSGYIVVGTTFSNDGDVVGNHGYNDLWVFKISATGMLQWQKCLGGNSGENAFAVGLTNDGGYIVAGNTGSNNNGDVTGNHGAGDEWIVKLTATGSIAWAKCYGGSVSDYPASVQQTFDGGYIIGGTSKSVDGDVTAHRGPDTNPNLWVIKITDTGRLEWERSLGHYSGFGSQGQFGGATIQTSDSAYVVAGTTYSGGDDVTGFIGIYDDYANGWVVKLNQRGIKQWDRCISLTVGTGINAIVQTTDAGYIYAGVDNNPIDNFALFGKLTSTGAIDWVSRYGQRPDTLNPSTSTVFNAVVLAADGTAIAAGYTDAIDGDISGNHGYEDCWVVKFGEHSSVAHVAQGNTITIAPNPASHILNISGSTIINRVSIINTLGQRLLSSDYNANSVQIDISALPCGFFFVRINNNESVRFLKQ